METFQQKQKPMQTSLKMVTVQHVLTSLPNVHLVARLAIYFIIATCSWVYLLGIPASCSYYHNFHQFMVKDAASWNSQHMQPI